MQYKDFDDYQKQAKKTAKYPDIGKNFAYPVIGLAGETGEVSEKIKRVIREDGGKVTKEARLEITKELGDVMWYIAQLSTELKIKLSDVIALNIKKLTRRKREGKIYGSGDNR
jgi:NTP pyrophosphatase (non-canonical NTP hydrolase)